MAQESTQYPFIGSAGTERGGIMVNPAVNSSYFTAPTETFTHYKSLMSSATMGATALVSGGIGKMVSKFNGTQYAIPVYTNA